MILLVEEILHQLRLVVYSIIYRVMYIWGGAGFLPSTVLGFVIHREISLKWLLDFSFIHPHPKLGRKWCFVFHVQPFLWGEIMMLSRPPRLGDPQAFIGSWKSWQFIWEIQDVRRFTGRNPSGRWSQFLTNEFRIFFLAKSVVKFTTNYNHPEKESVVCLGFVWKADLFLTNLF